MWLNFFAIAISFALSIPLCVVSFELLVNLFRNRLSTTAQESVEIKTTYKILIPAHNEAVIISKTLSNLLEQKILPSSIIVVADNCNDTTAEIAKSHGIKVLERFNDELRGKGFALDYGINHLKEEDDQPEVLIILDADCEINSDSLSLLASRCFKKDRPIQALYLMRNKNIESLKRRVAGFAWLVKNKLRPFAMNKLELPVTLTGTGMAFPWHVITSVNIANANIVEDIQLGIDCTLNGFAAELCEEAIVYSDFPAQQEAGETQRTRWEHGHLMMIVQQVPKLIQQAVIKKDYRLLALALDIGVPPLSLLVMLSLIGLFLLIIISYALESYFSFYLLLTSFLFFAVILFITWWRFGQDYLTPKEICSIPSYIISKLSIYTSFLFKRQKTWVRTERNENE
jgi:cellulose synthase/poly-beta-1,6-N-acetylglucosamine synthase-like glycosyltransferase